VHAHIRDVPDAAIPEDLSAVYQVADNMSLLPD
jgi:hypothetical protein